MMEVNAAPNDDGGGAAPDDDGGDSAPDEMMSKEAFTKIKKERRKWKQEETQVILYFLS